MDLRTAPSGARVLNDAYNAGPASMEAALRAVAHLDASRHHAVLGPMAELGPDGPGAHRAIGALADELGVRVVAVGTPEYGVDPVVDADAVVDALGPLGPDDAVLVKGSRVAGLERLASRLLA
jgi:UDP-N-acetylmuramoyl-tripeptide--D-alanyl-D-alanine ligase